MGVGRSVAMTKGEIVDVVVVTVCGAEAVAEAMIFSLWSLTFCL